MDRTTSGARRWSKERGCYAGEVDGLLNDRTVAALQRFQREHDRLTSHGRLDVATKTALGIDAPARKEPAAAHR